jgi:hypothetical protein
MASLRLRLGATAGKQMSRESAVFEAPTQGEESPALVIRVAAIPAVSRCGIKTAI